MKMFKYLSHSFSLVEKLKEGSRLSASPVSKVPQAQGSRHRPLSQVYTTAPELRLRLAPLLGVFQNRVWVWASGGNAVLPTSPAYLSPTSPGTQTISSGKTRDPGKLPAFFTEPPRPDSQSQAALHG